MRVYTRGPGSAPARRGGSRSCGLRRLGVDDAITELLDPAVFPPCPGQGALAVQVRACDRELLEMLSAFGDRGADAEVRAERALLGALHGGCSVPVGAHAASRDGVLSLSAQVTSLDGRQRVSGAVTGADPEATGVRLARELREYGAEVILKPLRPASPLSNHVHEIQIHFSERSVVPHHGQPIPIPRRNT